MNSLNNLQQRIQNAKDVDFGTVFNQCIELYKKVWVQGLLLQIFALLVMMPFIIMFYVPFIGAMMEQSRSGNVDPDALSEIMYGGGSALYILLFYLVIFALSAISALLYAGFYRIIKAMDHGQEFQTSDFFYFFKGKYFGKGFLLMILASLISGVAVMLCVLPVFYVMVPIMFFIPIFAYNPDLSIGDIISLGFNLGNKKWLLTFGLLIVSAIIVYLLTIITCGLGGLFLAAFMYMPIYIIYKEVIGFGDLDEIDSIGKIENI